MFFFVIISDMPLRDEFPETDTLSQGLASIAKAGRGLYTKSLAMQMKGTADALGQKIQKNQQTISALRKEKNEAKEWSDMVEKDNQELGSKLKRQEEENKQLKEENGGLRSKCGSYEAHFDKFQKAAAGDITLRISCSLGEKFPAELEEYFKALLWKAACGAKNNLHKDTNLRKFQVLEDFMQRNESFAPQNSMAEKLADGIKAALKQDNNDKRLKALENCGFDIVPEQHGHPKIRFHGDHALQFSPAATPSDKRGGKNLEREIINKCLLLVD